MMSFSIPWINHDHFGLIFCSDVSMERGKIILHRWWQSQRPAIINRKTYHCVAVRLSSLTFHPQRRGWQFWSLSLLISTNYSKMKALFGGSFTAEYVHEKCFDSLLERRITSRISPRLLQQADQMYRWEKARIYRERTINRATWYKKSTMALSRSRGEPSKESHIVICLAISSHLEGY